MSIALERGGGFMRACRQYEAAAAASCSSSSVGRNSDSDGLNGDGSDGGDEQEEVQSSFKGPLDTMDALEDSLPFSRRGISKFYCGKSKSFTTLADVITKSTSAKDLAKPKTPFTKKRKNLLPFSLKDMAKKPTINSSKRSSKMTSLDTSSSGSNSSSSEEDQGQNSLLPPPYPHTRQVVISPNSSAANQGIIMSGPMRSFSMADLQGMVGSSPLIGQKKNKQINRY
ncbi:hypothetical protein LUZ60_000958 [Juncus effusus]|nr:hypothetical protein LUZ60_000958 [Juncus effusus]